MGDEVTRVSDGAARAEDPSIAPAVSAVQRWLVHHEGKRTHLPDFLEALAARLSALGVPVFRVSLSLGDFHPEVVGRSYAWSRISGREEIDRRYTPKASDVYLLSPVRLVHEGADAVRQRLDDPLSEPEFQVMRELKAQGATDYVGMALPFSDGARHFISFATDAPGGFTTAHLSIIDALIPSMGLRIEIEHARRGSEQLLLNYLGQEAARRVLAGAIRRNMGEAITAVILASDLRGFTQLADTMPAETVIEALGHYFDAVAGPVRARGGDIVKMVGDGILALFPLTGFSPEADQARALDALDAVREAAVALEAIPSDALPEGIDALRAGFALHVGPVTFGNVGSRERLDFTAIGLAVNEAFRLETLTKSLASPIVTSASFAMLTGAEGLRSAGHHALRGVRAPKEVFVCA